jgi:hypothetical protein
VQGGATEAAYFTMDRTFTFIVAIIGGLLGWVAATVLLTILLKAITGDLSWHTDPSHLEFLPVVLYAFFMLPSWPLFSVFVYAWLRRSD